MGPYRARARHRLVGRLRLAFGWRSSGVFLAGKYVRIRGWRRAYLPLVRIAPKMALAT